MSIDLTIVRHNRRMMYDDIKARVQQRLDELGISSRAASMRVTGKPDLFRPLLKDRVKSPRSDTLEKMAEALGVSEEWILHGSTAPAATKAAAHKFLPDNRSPHPADSVTPRDVPLLGSASGSTIGKVEGFQLNDPVDYVLRPPALTTAKGLYAIFVEGDSMAPQHSSGDLRFVHPHKPPQPGQSVIVQTKAWQDDPGQAYIKIFEKRTQSKLILRQLNPAATIEIPAQYVTALHRVLTTAELFGV